MRVKFANIIYNKRNGQINIGDDMQILAVENLYRKMGVDYSQVVRIEFKELYTYDGEYVILPISFPIIGYSEKNTITCFSPKIIPVFLGVCILARNYSKEDIDYLRKFEPIGCRDMYTLSTMQKYSIKSYLNSCMTLTLPKVRNIDDAKKLRNIFCVDVPNEIIEIIPQELSSECVYKTHALNIEDLDYIPEEYCRRVYKQYISEARMVITSRMHVALPCIAAGIPTIFAKNKYSFRFSGIDRVAKIYTKNEYDKINWNPDIVEYEDLKEKMLDLATKRIRKTFCEWADILNLSYEFENLSRPKYYIESIDSATNFINNKWNKNDKISFALWGITQTAEILYDYIYSHYHNAFLEVVIDKRIGIQFKDLFSKPKECIGELKNTYIFVCADAAEIDACHFEKKDNSNTYFYCFRGYLD